MKSEIRSFSMVFHRIDAEGSVLICYAIDLAGMLEPILGLCPELELRYLSVCRSDSKKCLGQRLNWCASDNWQGNERWWRRVLLPWLYRVCAAGRDRQGRLNLACRLELTSTSFWQKDIRVVVLEIVGCCSRGTDSISAVLRAELIGSKLRSDHLSKLFFDSLMSFPHP